MDDQKIRFIDGALKNIINKNEASKIFDLVNKFAGYGFNKSHAAGYALIAYQTAFLKANFPHEFMTATLNFSIDRTDKIISLKLVLCDQVPYFNTHLAFLLLNFNSKNRLSPLYLFDSFILYP